MEEIYFDNNSITDRIEELIKRQNITAYKLCKDLKIPNGSYYNIKRGRQIWGLEPLIKISLYFKTSIDFLVFGKAVEGNQDKIEIEKLKENVDELKIRISYYKNLIQNIGGIVNEAGD